MVAHRRVALPIFAALLACGSEVTNPETGGAGGTPAAGGASSSSGGSSSMGGGGSGGSAAGGSAAGGSAAGGSGGAAAVLTLDPSTLEVFYLPIGSLRAAVAGQDQNSDTCVSLIWTIGSAAEQFEPMCAAPPMQDFPYVVITPGAQAPCVQWDYAGNVLVNDAVGCVELHDTQPPSADVEMSVEVSGAPFTGTIVVDNVP